MGNDQKNIIPATEVQIRQALRGLLSKEVDLLNTLFTSHDDYNKQYFSGELEQSVITIERMSNKVLASYQPGKDTLGLLHRYRFNRNFIALNPIDRILETLKHEMIHQYQEQILYAGKKKPKNWHNKEFKDIAHNLGIPANGTNGAGNPAIMPQGKSYNRKYHCDCISDTGHPLTVWSTREIIAKCTNCGKDFIEAQKKGEYIEVVTTAKPRKEGE